MIALKNQYLYTQYIAVVPNIYAVLSIFMISIKKSYPYLEVGNKTNRAMHKKIADEY